MLPAHRSGSPAAAPPRRVVHRLVPVLLALALLPAPARAQPVVQWNFNGQSFTPNVGSGTVTVLGGVSSAFVGGDNQGAGTLAGGSSDPGTPNALGDLLNYVPRLTGFPAASGTGGLRISGIDTTTLANGLFAFDLAAVAPNNPATSASRWYQVRYSTDGTTYQNLGGPLEYQRTLSGDASLWANQTVLSLAAIPSAANLRLEVVATHAPGTGSYAAAGFGTTYSAGAPVGLDMVTVFRGNTWNGSAGSGDLQAAGNWSLGAPVAGALSSHLVFGGNANTNVTVTNTTSLFRVQSISFAATATATAYTIAGQQINLGKADSGADTLLGGVTTLTNGSALPQTIGAVLLLQATQTWDSGRTAGGSLILSGPEVTFMPSVNLQLIGSNPVVVNAALQFLGNNIISVGSSGGLTLGAPGLAFGTPGQFNVDGTLTVTNATGSATADSGIAVNSGGRLTGHGRVAPGTGQTVTIRAGGTVSAGTSAANRVLTIGANGLTVQSGGVVELAIFGTGAADAGRLDVTGAVTSSGGILNLSLQNGVTAASLRDAVFAEGGSRTYTVITATAASTFDFTPGNLTALGFSASEWTVATAGNTLTFTFHPIPEPSTVLGVGAAVLLLGRVVRRGRKPAAAPAG